jgi:hypothetical protein
MERRINAGSRWKRRSMKGSGASGAVYGLGFIGAAVYYIQHAATFWAGVVALFKALVWPALLIYRVLTLLKM